jgi:hypothetical protein
LIQFPALALIHSFQELRKKLLVWDKKKYREIVEKLIELNVIEQVNVPLGKKRPIVLYQLKGKKPSIKHESHQRMCDHRS